MLKEEKQCAIVKLTNQETIPDYILALKSISVNAKRIYGQIAHYAGAGLSKPASSVYVSTGYLASRLGIARKTVSRAVGQLQGAGLIDIKRQFKESNEYTIRPHRPKKFFLLLDIQDSRVNIANKLILAYLKFRQGENKTAWPMQATIAKDLGLSLRKVQLGLATLERDGYIKINHKTSGNTYSNCYSSFNQCRTELRERTTSLAQNCPTIDNNCKELKTIKPVNSSNLLSAGAAAENQTEKRSLLISNGVHPSVAKDIAGDKRVSLASVKAAIYNGIARNDKSGLWRMRPGYIVAAINAANDESKAVKLSKAGKAMLNSHNAAKAKQAVRTSPLAGAELEARKELIKSQIAMLLAEEAA